MFIEERFSTNWFLAKFFFDVVFQPSTKSFMRDNGVPSVDEIKSNPLVNYGTGVAVDWFQKNVSVLIFILKIFQLFNLRVFFFNK